MHLESFIFLRNTKLGPELGFECVCSWYERIEHVQVLLTRMPWLFCRCLCVYSLWAWSRARSPLCFFTSSSACLSFTYTPPRSPTTHTTSGGCFGWSLQMLVSRQNTYLYIELSPIHATCPLPRSFGILLTNCNLCVGFRQTHGPFSLFIKETPTLINSDLIACFNIRKYSQNPDFTVDIFSLDWHHSTLHTLLGSRG